MKLPVVIDENKIEHKEINELFGVPVRNLHNWAKEERNNWRFKLYTQLKQIGAIFDVSLEVLRKRFKKNEMKALIASVNSTIPSNEFYLSEEAWAWHFEDACHYEPMEIGQFLEGENLDTFRKAVSAKLKELDPFTRYVLFRVVFGFWGEENEVKNLEEYLEEKGWK